LRIDGIELLQPSWRLLPFAGGWVSLSAASLKASRVVWRSPRESAPGTGPPPLQLPLALQIDTVQVDELQIDDAAPWRDVRARIQVGSQDGSEHRVEALSLHNDRLRISADARIGTAAPLPLALTLRATPLGGEPWQADVRADGPLSDFSVRASLRGDERNSDAPALDVLARIAPFADWPLASLQLSTRALDLATLSSAAPRTRIDAQADVRSAGLDRPASATVSVHNHTPGRWEAGRLPVREVQLELGGTPSQLDRIEIRQLGVWLADDRQAAWEEARKLTEPEHERVVKLGGLHIIGTERHESRRIDNQLRGRSGRQGDPGSSRFYLSLEDDLLRIFGSERIQRIMERLGMEEGEPIEHKLVTRAIGTAQKRVETRNFEIRKHLLEYDDVMNKQREIVYGLRRDILEGESQQERILEWAGEVAEGAVMRFASRDTHVEDWDLGGLNEALYRHFGTLEKHIGPAQAVERQLLHFEVGLEAAVPVDLGAELQRLAGGVRRARPCVQHRAAITQARNADTIEQVSVDARHLRRGVGPQAQRAAAELIDQLEGLQVEFATGARQQRLEILE